ncbi:MAG: HTTM domain-containing protein [Caulobacterales bacterium]|nr:HTTM domain-containing protein [Caulobacterales bacterium]
MTFEAALRASELLLGFALFQHSLEHLTARGRERALFAARAGLSLALMIGAAPGWTGAGLLALGMAMLARFDGPYNGGADRMSLLALICLTLAHILPDPRWREIAFGYLAAQLVLSYVLSGWVKIVNAEWRDGRALRDVFAFSAYPVGESLRGLAERRRPLLAASWGVMGFELLFPIALVSQPTLIAALVIAGAFHLANACLFGLNRFFWAWIAAYPSILWLQGRVAQAWG